MSLSSANHTKLETYYKDGNSHQVRQRAQIILLYYKQYNITQIGYILDLQEWYVKLCIVTWKYFQFSEFFNFDEDDLYTKIHAYENPKPKIKPKAKPKPLPKEEPTETWRQYFSSKWDVFKGFVFIILWKITGLTLDNIKKFQRKGDKIEQKNVSIINGFFNVVTQINLVIIENGKETYKHLEELRATSIKEFIEHLKLLRDMRNEGLVTNDRRLNWFLALMDKYEKHKFLAWIILWVFGIWIFHYGFVKSFGGGVIILGGSVYMAMPSDQVTLTVETPDNSSITIAPAKNTNPQKNKANSYNDVDFSTFPKSTKNDYLVGIGQAEISLLENDTTNYQNLPFLINKSKNRFYLQVIAYSDIKYAVLQRLNLKRQGFDSKIIIIEEDKNSSPYYGVTIGDYSRNNNNNDELFDLVNVWNDHSNTEDAKAILKYF